MILKVKNQLFPRMSCVEFVLIVDAFSPTVCPFTESKLESSQTGHN